MATPAPERASGPDVHLVAIEPADGVGTDCEMGAADCGVPTNATLSFRFDRFLSPATANRQALRVYSGDPDNGTGIPFDVVYDPVERVVQYRMPSGYSFAPNALYQLELVVPVEPGDFGIRAFDGAPLAEGSVPLRGSFFTGLGPVELEVEEPPGCAEIVSEVFMKSPASCGASGQCHASTDAPHGLWLDGRANFAVTAVNRVARQTEVGDRSGGVPLEQPKRFGVQMPLVQPGNPGNSYLLYKLLRSARSYQPCVFDENSAASSFCSIPVEACASLYPGLPLDPGSGKCLAPSDDELERLREWFVRGEAMPIPRPVDRSLGLQQLRAISRFIAAGANCNE